MRYCDHGPDACPGDDLPPCSAILRGEEGQRLRALATRLLPRAGAAALAFHESVRHRCGEAALPREGEVSDLLARAAAGDPAAIAITFIAEGRRLSRAGVPLQSVILRAHLFSEACADTLASMAADPLALLDARASLDRLCHVRVTLEACAYLARGAPPREPEAICSASDRARCSAAAESPSPFAGRTFHGLAGASPPMRRLFAEIELAAREAETVLIVGESGTGKELVARAIHARSGDDAARFVTVRCAALPRDDGGNSLSGRSHGAADPASTGSAGPVQAVTGGTLFLDEISELPPEAQTRLLHLIQERPLRTSGHAAGMSSPLRIVASTTRPLASLLPSSRLRRDLFHRLQRFVIEVPPLRDRLEDLPLLADHFVALHRSYSEPLRALHPAALEHLALHTWPGNVREFENVILAACRRTTGPLILLSDVPPLPPPDPPSAGPRSLRDAEKAAISAALHEADGNKSLASRLLGISRKQLYVKLRLYHLDPP